MTEGVARARARALPGVLWRALRGLRKMSRGSRREYIVVLMLACCVELAVRVLPLQRVARLCGVRLGPSTTAGPPASVDLDLPPWAMRRLWVVSKVMRRWPVDGECLRQALVAGQRLHALHPELRLGVSKSGTTVSAHAWISIDGQSLDPSSDQFSELPFPLEGRAFS